MQVGRLIETTFVSKKKKSSRILIQYQIGAPFMKKLILAIATLFLPLTGQAQSVTIYTDNNPATIQITREDIARGYKNLNSVIRIRNDELVTFTYVSMSYWFNSHTKVVIHPGGPREIVVPVRLEIKPETAIGEFPWPLSKKE